MSGGYLTGGRCPWGGVLSGGRCPGVVSWGGGGGVIILGGS